MSPPNPTTESGIEVDAFYGPPPGVPPYTRGIHESMYRGRPWTIRQLAGFGSAPHTNERLRMLLDGGATGINTVFDYPTNRGYDSDHPFAEGDAGQGGVAIDVVEDVLALYDGIPIDKISVSIVLSHPVGAVAMLAMYLAAAERLGVAWTDLKGTLQNDFLMETVVLTAPDTLQPWFSFALSMDAVEFCAEHVPGFNPVSFTGYNYREAGAGAVQEAALVCAHAAAAVDELARRGCNRDLVASKLSAFFTADNDFFEEVAKYRAARRVYWRVLGEHGVTSERGRKLRYHVQTAGSSLTAQQPLNNAVRAAFQALAAVLGGAQSIHVSGYDEALCVPTEAAAMLAMRTQQIIQLETGVTRTADPLGGSHYVEHLTDEMERRIEDWIARIAEQGGLVAAVESGWIHSELIGNAYEREQAISAGERPVVGVNVHQVAEESTHEHFRVPHVLDERREMLAHHRASRDAAVFEASIAALRTAVEAKQNVMPALLDCARAGATMGECCDVFRTLRGGWVQPLR